VGVVIRELTDDEAAALRGAARLDGVVFAMGRGVVDGLVHDGLARYLPSDGSGYVRYPVITEDGQASLDRHEAGGRG
jgi:hypothetical protein